MKYIDGFRNPDAAATINRRIAQLGEDLATRKPGTGSGIAHIMEVCGTHTMAIARYGIREVLPDNIDLISGPGCPVCVTDTGYIDAAIELGLQDAIIATFGDMVQVPGSESTLSESRSRGASVRSAIHLLTPWNSPGRTPGVKWCFWPSDSIWSSSVCSAWVFRSAS